MVSGGRRWEEAVWGSWNRSPEVRGEILEGRESWRGRKVEAPPWRSTVELRSKGSPEGSECCRGREVQGTEAIGGGGRG